MIQSTFRSKRQWASVSELNAANAGQEIWLRCRLETVRATGFFLYITVNFLS
jgi:hypothetical protein